jgi:hypothetical protein
MPILSYFFVAGTALLALLFYANASMEPRGPLAVTTDFEGLPRPWQGPAAPNLASRPAPAPDMNSDAVLAAAPQATASGKLAATTSGVAPVEQTAAADTAPKKKKHVARKAPRQDEHAPRYAWQSGNPSPFGFFGRF